MVTTTRYIYDGNQYLAEADEHGTINRLYTNEPDAYTHLISQEDVSTGDSLYYHYDAIGSTRQVTDDTETVTDEFTYDAWGNRLSRTGTSDIPFQFVGEHGYYRDEFSLSYYIMRRVYNPVAHRWLSVDPLWRIDPWGRLYSYSANNPTRKIDASGLEETDLNCDVTLFEVERYPPGLYASKSKAHVGKPFKIKIKFSGCCKCCEYRQYIVYSLQAVDYVDHTGTPIPYRNRTPRQKLYPLRNFDGLRPDCVVNKAGVTECLGYRNPPPGLAASPLGRYCMSPTDGCGFLAHDIPGFSRSTFNEWPDRFPHNWLFTDHLGFVMSALLIGYVVNSCVKPERLIAFRLIPINFAVEVDFGHRIDKRWELTPPPHDCLMFMYPNYIL